MSQYQERPRANDNDDSDFEFVKASRNDRDAKRRQKFERRDSRFEAREFADSRRFNDWN